jgi:hypothetical protein
MARVPGGPVDAPPRGFMPQAEQAQILAGVLAGIELGAWDRQIVQWLAGWDTCTVLTVASLIAPGAGRRASRVRAMTPPGVSRPAHQARTTSPWHTTTRTTRR